MEEKFIDVFSAGDFRRWLEKNHDKEKRIGLVLHKKHTGKPSASHRELMNEAICFGWIDTTLRPLDNDKFIRFFNRRNKNSKWSENTLSYAKQLIKDGKMTPHGLKFYHEGRKKKAFDHGIPKNPDMIPELEKALSKNKKAKENFSNLTKTVRRVYLRWILMAKQEKTRERRIKKVIARMLEKDWRILRF